MNTPTTKSHFLVSKRKHLEVSAVAIGGRIVNGAVDLAGFVAGPAPAPAAVVAASPESANEEESAPGPAPAPAPAPVTSAPTTTTTTTTTTEEPITPPPVAKYWESVSEPIQEHVASVVEWAKEAQEAAQKSSADAAKITEAGTKAGGSMTTVIAEVGNAKAAMDNAIAKEKKISALYDKLYQKAKDAALEEVPGILKELRKKAQDKADKKAKKQAKVFEKNMKAKGKAMSAKAAKVYLDQMAAAGKSAAAYAKLGDGLIAQSAALQMNAGLASGGANAMMMTGQMGEAQKMYQNSRSDMNLGLAFNAQATKMYDTANTITAQMPAYAGQAAMAGFHAQVMYDPKAVAPPPPLV